jgi:hypothetical protein
LQHAAIGVLRHQDKNRYRELKWRDENRSNLGHLPGDVGALEERQLGEHSDEDRVVRGHQLKQVLASVEEGRRRGESEEQRLEQVLQRQKQI